MKLFNRFLSVFCVGALVVFSACEDDDPTPENVPEVITRAELTFTAIDNSSAPAVVVTATDADGIGSAEELEADGPINLRANVTYALSIKLYNDLFDAGEEGYDVTEEVDEEDEEHWFFFGFTSGVFSNPTGNGNIISASFPNNGTVRYADEDDDGRPLGLLTNWTTINDNSGSGKIFRVILKHFDEVEKTDDSTSDDGETDIDVTFVINVTQPS
ncbi:MAG: hypothetical protein MUC38_06925 [Cyclobacteriaceae bacterium]|jgi:hypothetical protein|nr:hypothetical protein [Cyclobacteriaceae bacterium]